jgi:hypothetical protein
MASPTSGMKNANASLPWVAVRSYCLHDEVGGEGVAARCPRPNMSGTRQHCDFASQQLSAVQSVGETAAKVQLPGHPPRLPLRTQAKQLSGVAVAALGMHAWLQR